MLIRAGEFGAAHHEAKAAAFAEKAEQARDNVLKTKGADQAQHRLLASHAASMAQKHAESATTAKDNDGSHGIMAKAAASRAATYAQQASETPHHAANASLHEQLSNAAHAASTDAGRSNDKVDHAKAASANEKAASANEKAGYAEKAKYHRSMASSHKLMSE